MAIENNRVPRVQELLQKGRTGGEVSSEEMIFLRTHIGWLERQCHENALRTDKANYTMTDRKPDFFFLGNRKLIVLNVKAHIAISIAWTLVSLLTTKDPNSLGT